ncbi:MAG: hypothetical protein FWD39_05005 [Clostridiales bacterium]|nr:hypothetical protein [Clostridiales bacterium]
MKQRLFLILLALALVFALAACAGSADVDEPGDPDDGRMVDLEYVFIAKSLEDIVRGKQAADPENDPCKVGSLNHYYVPVYAENRYILNMIRVEEGGVIPVYSSDEQKQDTFLLAVSRSTEYAEYELARTINPNSYSTSIAPQPV